MDIFYDTHAHLDYPDYAADLPHVIERARVAGIARIITIGTDLESSARAVKLSEQYPSVFAAVGWHPTNVLEAPDDLRPELRKLAAHPRSLRSVKRGWIIIICPAKNPAPTVTPIKLINKNRRR